MSAHTPGPWAVYPHPPTEPGEVATEFSVGQALARDGDIPIVEVSGAADAHLIAAAPDLLALLRMALPLIGGTEHATENYDALAADFYRDTGVMAPGKDVPAAMGLAWSDDDRQKAWRDWLNRTRETVGRQAREVLAKAEGSC